MRVHRFVFHGQSFVPRQATPRLMTFRTLVDGFDNVLTEHCPLLFGPLKEKLLGDARAFVLPSALEGLPITLLEAMSYARPCLVSSIPPHQDVIRDGQNGFLHHDADFGHLRNRLKEIMDANHKDLSHVGESARETVAEEYDWEKVVDKMERLYEMVLGTTHPPHDTGGQAIALHGTIKERWPRDLI